MCRRKRSSNGDIIPIYGALQPPLSVVEEYEGQGHRRREENDCDLENELLRFRTMAQDEIRSFSPPRRASGRGRSAAVESESLTNQLGDIGGSSTRDKLKRGGRAKPPAAASKYGYRGVHKRTYGRWASEIRDTNKGHRVWIGTYDTAEEAARAYDAEARRIHGRKAKTNFPADEHPAPVAAKAWRTKRPNKGGAHRCDHGDAVKPPPVSGGCGLTEDPRPAAMELDTCTAALSLALEVTDGWEFEPYSRELLGGGVLGYADEQEHGVADGLLWSF